MGTKLLMLPILERRRLVKAVAVQREDSPGSRVSEPAVGNDAGAALGV